MTAPAELHTITLSHDACDHTPGDDFSCNPRIDTVQCLSDPGARCRFGCVDCTEYWIWCNDGPEDCARLRQDRIDDWELDPAEVLAHPVEPHCTEGHAFQVHDCWAAGWIQSNDGCVDEGLFRRSDRPGVGEVWPDGPVQIEDWSEDSFVISYAAEANS